MRRKKIKDVEQEYNVDFGVNKNMNLSTWLRRNNLPSLRRALDKTEDKLNNQHLCEEKSQSKTKHLKN